MSYKSTRFYKFTVLITKETLPSGGLFEKTFPLKKEKTQYSVLSGLTPYKNPVSFPRTEETSNIWIREACILYVVSPPSFPRPHHIKDLIKSYPEILG